MRQGRYRWAVLGAGVFAQAALSAVQLGLPAIAPVLRDELGLSLNQVGVVLASVSWGITAPLLLWGWLADRIGERIVVSVGLAGGAVALVAGAYTSGYGALVVSLVAAGALAGCTSIASGRAVMGWFGRHQRGLALGVRQMAVPVGGAIGALTLPAIAAARRTAGGAARARRRVRRGRAGLRPRVPRPAGRRPTSARSAGAGAQPEPVAAVRGLVPLRLRAGARSWASPCCSCTSTAAWPRARRRPCWPRSSSPAPRRGRWRAGARTARAGGCR